MQFLHTVHCAVFNNLQNQHWNCYLFCLLQIHEPNKETTSRYNYVYQAANYSYKREISNKLTLKTEHVTFSMT